MENNVIQMAVSAGHAVAHTIGPILNHIIDCGFTNIGLQLSKLSA